jgi:hypothetical protein
LALAAALASFAGAAFSFILSRILSRKDHDLAIGYFLYSSLLLFSLWPLGFAHPLC